MKARFGFLASALVAALCAQHWLTPLGASRAYAELPKGRASLGFALLLFAGLVAAAVFWLDDDSGGEGDGALPPGPDGAPIDGLLRASVALIVGATALAYFDIQSSVAIYPWCAGLVLLLVFARSHSSPAAGARYAMSGLDWGVLLFLVGLAFLWRYPGLAEIPAQVHGDEAACGIEARRILRGDVPNLLGLGWYDIPYLSFALSALFMRVFGDNLFGLRMASVCFGVASVALLYLTVRRLYGSRVAALAGALLAVSHWHIHFSRIGTDYMQASFAAMLALFFFVRARQDGRWLDWVLSGLAVGLSCSVYYAGRVVLVILAGFIVIERLLDPPSSRRFAAGMTLMLLAAVLFVAPIFAVTARVPSTLTDRSRSVFLLSPRNLEHALESTGAAGLPQLLGVQAAKSLSAFNWRGERSDQHGHAAPLLDFWSGAAFAVGLVGVTAVGWRRRYRMVVLWFWANLILGSVLTVDAMFSPRMIVAVPVLFVFPALLLARLATMVEGLAGRNRKTATAVVLAGFVAASAIANYRDYFDLHVGKLQTPRRPTILARFVDEVSRDYRVYVYGRYSLRYDTPRFLVPEVDGEDMGVDRTDLPTPADLGGKGLAFVLDPEWPGRSVVEAAILETYPDSRRETLLLAEGRPAFEVFRWRAAEKYQRPD